MIVEFAGIPRSGKTSVVTALFDYYSRKGYETKLATEGAKLTPFSHRERVETAFWVANHVGNQIISASIEKESQVLHLFDRGLFDAMSFIKLLEIEGLFNGNGGELTKKLLDNYLDYLSFWAHKVDVVFWFQLDPQIAIQRDLSSKMSAGPGLITNEITLKKLNKAYAQIIDTYGKNFPRIEAINHSGEDSLDIAKRVRDVIDRLRGVKE